MDGSRLAFAIGPAAFFAMVMSEFNRLTIVFASSSPVGVPSFAAADHIVSAQHEAGASKLHTEPAVLQIAMLM